MTQSRKQKPSGVQGFSAFVRMMSLLLTFSVLWGCQKSPESKPEIKVPVEAFTLHKSKVQDSTEYLAKIESRESVMLHPQVSGQVAQILVNPGDFVKAGQSLIKIDSRQQQAELQSTVASTAVFREQIRQSEAALKATMASQDVSKSRQAFQNQQLSRYQNLYEVESSSLEKVQQTTDALGQATAELKTNEHQVDANRYSLAATQKKYLQSLADVRQKQAVLSYYSIRAPFSGYVTNIPVKIGDFVNYQTQVTGVASDKELQLVLSIPAEKAPYIRKGAVVNILDDNNETTAQAVVYFVAETVNTDSQSVVVRGKFKKGPNEKSSRLLSDQAVRAVMVWSESTGLRVPVKSTINLGGQDFIFVVDNQNQKQTARQVPVVLGDIIGNDYVVKQGLKEGDVVISSGIQKLKNGMAVLPQLISSK